MQKVLKNFLYYLYLVFNIFYFLSINSERAISGNIVPPSPFKGLNGLTFDLLDQLYVGSVIDQNVYKIDVQTGNFELAIPNNQGQADDLFINSNGQIFYTAPLSGEVRFFDSATGYTKTILSGLSGVNPITQDRNGRLFVAQTLTNFGNGLYEIDPNGNEQTRLILNQPGFLNAFDFGSDGLLYAPTQLTGEIVKINVDTGNLEQLTSGLVSPVSAKFNSHGELFALDTATGEVLRIDTTTGNTETIVQLSPGLDNIAFNSQDLMYVSNYVDSSIHEINTNTGKVRTVIESEGLTAPGGIAVYDNKLYVADTYSYRVLNQETGEILQTFPTFATPNQFPLNISVNEDHTISSSWFAGVVQRQDRITGNAIDTYTGFVLPYDAVELSDASILVADCGSGQIIQIFDRLGINRHTVAEGLFCPTGLALIDDFQVLVTESVGNRLSLINILTGELKLIADDLLFPEGVAYHQDGIALVAEVGSQRVRAIHLATGHSLVLEDDLPIGFPGFSGGPPPYGMTGIAISDDKIYVSGDIDNSIRTIDFNWQSGQPTSVPESTPIKTLILLGSVGIVFILKRKVKSQ